MNNPETSQVPKYSPQGRNLLTYLLLFFSLIAIIAVLRLASSILIPFALAIFLAFLLYPVVNFLNKLKIPYGLAVALVMLLLLIIFLGMGAVIVDEINSFVKALPQYQAALKTYLEEAQDIYNKIVDKFAELLPGEPEPAVKPSTSPANILANLVFNLLSGLSLVVSFLKDFIIILFMLIFLLADARIFKEKLIKAWGTEEETKAKQIVEEINQGISGYILIRTTINIGLAVVITIVLLILDIDYAYIWGPLTGLLNFIPYLGAFLSIIPPLIVALASYETIWTPLAVVIVYIVIQNVEGNFITPKLVGKRVNLNALAVLLSLILWGFIWGPVGMILATPLTTCFKILCDHIEPLKPIGILLSGQKKNNRRPNS